jgi:predicted phosphodiesterase
MRVAALYDIHGNLPALEAVLADVARAHVDYIVVGGDVLPGPMPRECLACLRALATPVDFICGNGEAAVLAARAGRDLDTLPQQAREAVRWVADELRPAEVARIASWPAAVRVDIAGFGEVLFCHATPRSDTEIFTASTPASRLQPIFDAAGAALVVCGHTHIAFDRTVGQVRVVNAGSVGMPFDEPGAYWALIGPALELRCTPYDLVAAAAVIRSTRYPQGDVFAERHVLRPPSAAQMSAFYAGVELQQ